MVIDYIQNKDYLEVIISSDYSLSEANKFFTEMLNYLVEYKWSRVLVNCLELSGDFDILEEYYLAEFAAGKYKKMHLAAKIQSTKFSYVLNDKFYNEEKDGESLADNRGLWIKTFQNKEEAIQWLLISYLSPGSK